MSETVSNGAHGIHTKAVHRISLIFKPEESSVKVQENQYDKFAVQLILKMNWAFYS